MRKLGFKQKLWLPLLVSLTALLLVSVSAACLSYQARIDERRNDLTNVAHVGLAIVEEYAALARTGTLTEDQARQQALARLRDVRYGEDGYFLVINSGPQMVMHPIKPSMDGKDLGTLADADGRHHYVAFARVAQAPQGGFVDYVFPRPHVTPAKAVDKLGYVVRYAPWDWIIATGAYVDDIDAAFRTSLYAAGGLFLVLALLLAALVALINRSIERTIGGDPNDAAHVTDAIASCNLAIVIRTRVNDTDSLMQTIRRMRDALKKTIGEIRGVADNVAVTAREIASGNADLSARTENQAASLQRTASSLEQITSMVHQTADHARSASQLVASAAQITDRGGAMVVEAVETMRAISSESQKMVDIIAVIEGIAFQTNILALNAAVEAARAGEEGRGFAVVASEVRSLAQRSASAAKEIRGLIQNAVGKVGAGAELVEQTGATIQEAQGAMARVTGIVREIALAVAEQSAGIEQINVAVTQMDNVTQQNAALVEQAAAAAQSFEEQARQLQAAVAAFSVGDAEPVAQRRGGSGGAAVAPVRRASVQLAVR
jgi:methyl-accepting chemotaxis protein